MTTKNADGWPRRPLYLSDDIWAWVTLEADLEHIDRNTYLFNLIEIEREKSGGGHRIRPTKPVKALHVTPWIESYAVATAVRDKDLATPAGRYKHIIKEPATVGLCGFGPLGFVGMPDQPYEESWEWCIPCSAAAGPEIMKGWQ